MNTNDEWLKPSEQALGDRRGLFAKKYNFPFDAVPVGMSFRIEKDAIKNINTLRTLASSSGKKLNRRFKVIDHGESGFEVFYVEPRSVEEPKRRGWDLDAV